MLKKLLKYDLVNIFKFLSIFYFIALFFSICTRLFFLGNTLITKIMGQICLSTMISMIVSILINNLMRLWVRFRQQFYGDESYLIHTLPVSKQKLLLSKFLTGIISVFVSSILIALFIFISLYSKDNANFINKMFTENFNFQINIYALFALIFLFIFVELLNVLICGYLGIILAHKINNKKIAYSVLFSFAIYLISQIIVIALIGLLDLVCGDAVNIFNMTYLDLKILKIVSIYGLFVYLIIIAIVYLLSDLFFKQGVNVD